jgi:hypothetical protein
MKVTIDKKMIESVIADFELENPELSYFEMSSAEFADRMMKKIEVTDESPQDIAERSDG